MKKLKVYHIGSDIHGKGGMATVIRTLLNSELKELKDLPLHGALLVLNAAVRGKSLRLA